MRQIPDRDQTMSTDIDPVLERRARVADLVSKGLRLGTALYVVASVIFFVAYMVGFTSTAVTLIIICLIVGSALLAPALVFKYGVKAAERADRDNNW